jgi:hypothetical protein
MPLQIVHNLCTISESEAIILTRWRTFSLTTFLAVWGAILSSIVFGWTLYRDLRDRAKIMLTAEVRRLAQREDGKYFTIAPDQEIAGQSEALFVVISVVNVGRRRMCWKGAGGYYKHPVNGKNAFVLTPRYLPKVLEEQEAHDELTELDSEFIRGNIKQLYVWDVAGRQWSVSRRDLKRLGADARKYSQTPRGRRTDWPCG